MVDHGPQKQPSSLRKIVAESRSVSREMADLPITREQAESLRNVLAHDDENERLGFFSGALAALREAGHVVKYADPVVYWRPQAAELLRKDEASHFVRKN